MAQNLATLNARGLRDPSKCSYLIDKLSNFRVDVPAVQETHFTCAANCRVMEGDYVVLSSCSRRSSVVVTLLIGRNLNADVNLVLADDEDRLAVANVTVKSFEFWVDAVYAPNIAAERVSFF